MSRTRSVRRPLGAVFLALTLMLTIFNTTLPARAEENSAITVSGLSLVRSTVGGENQDGKIEVGGYAKLSFTWDATRANVKSGDSFSIDLGANFRNLDFPKTTPMSILYDGAEKQIGSCELTRTRVVCTFDGTVDELRNSGFTSFSGTGQALLVATTSTTSQTANITANGVVTAVQLPAGGGIPGPDYGRWGSLSKWGGAIAENATSVQWGINFNTTSLTQDTGMVFDGSTNQTLTFTDTLGDGMTFSTDLTTARLLLRNSATDPAREAGDPIVNAAGEDLSSAYGDFDMTMTTEGSTATITVTGPFAPETNYFIVYNADFPGGSVVKGFQYQNSVTLQGLNQTRSAERYYVDSFSISVEMAAGFGGFDVTKLLRGNGASSVPDGTSLTVAVNYELPAAASAYEGWTAPGTLNADRRTGTTTMTVRVGQKTPYPSTFPAGTRITLEEDTSTASPAPDGYAWGDPVFTIGNRTTNTLTIGDQTSVAVNLSNQVTALGTFSVTKSVSGVSAGDKEFTFTYDCSDGQTGSLTVKGDGAAVTADRSFPLGTECTISEDTSSAEVPNHALDVPQDQTVTISDAMTPIPVSFTNNYTRNEGALLVRKLVTGDYQASSAEMFTVNYRCDDGSEGSLDVPGDGSEVLSPRLPAGIVCTITEDAHSAERDGYVVATSYSDTSVVISGSAALLLTVTNDYTRLVGGFTIAKSVDGDGASLAPRAFAFDYDCVDEAGEPTRSGSVAVEAGTAASVTDVPVGRCTVTERNAEVIVADQETRLTVDGQEASGPSVSFDVTDGAEIAVAATNTYTLHRGTFSVAKSVSGVSAGDKEFTFTYDCSDGQTGSLTAKGDGRAVTADASFPLGTWCTVSEDADAAQIDGYTLDVPQDRTVTITEKDQVVPVDFENAYTRDEATFSVAKQVTGDYQASPSDAFTVNYSCDNDATGSLVVPGDGSEVSGPRLPTGTSCTITEDAGSAERAGFAVATRYSDTTVTIAKGENPVLTVTNDYTRLVGGFTVAKTVDGDGASLAPTSFTFDYDCTDEAGESTVSGELTVGAGATASVTNVPVGRCTVTERDAEAAGTDLAAILTLDGQEASGPSASFDVVNGAEIAIAATNTYTLHRGTFSVAKSVSGASAGDKEFTFTYDCTDGQTGSLTVPGDGTAVTADTSFPLGTECTISEDADAAQIDGYTLDAPQDRTVTVSERDQVVPVEFENVYTPVPEPTPSTPDETPESSTPAPEPSTGESPRRHSTSPSGLPRTGAGAAGLTAALVCVVAAVPLLRRRRR
ncbi:Adhesion domain [Propionibacterium ruminifibrarum]|uniref:Adhesion domain n=1 Tax=Propionibacterium ruminifibrarum TaxID=1962131 RepID=A0A375I1N6_9ACTN|nr:DUF5979 domain-containing protein [Propionibacterium ruminifibrarum]SPF68722.1 Adhesion domain [Propionibacterium ruminifibrarum]